MGRRQPRGRGRLCAGWNHQPGLGEQHEDPDRSSQRAAQHLPVAPTPLEGTARNDVAAADARATNGRLVFTRFVRGEFDEQRNEIYTSRSDGTAVRQLTFRGENTGPQWAPFGNRIVFSRNGDIWVMGANGGHKHRLVGGPALDYEPAWAPRGRRIVFVRGLESARLVVYSLATESSRRIPGSFAHPAGPKWSPNGRQIIFAGTVANDSETPDLYTVRPGGRGLRNLTSTPRIWENGPDWSPNGHRIVYVHEGNRCRTLHVMRSDGTDDQRLPRSCPAEYPAWSPDGIKVAFNPHRKWVAACGQCHERHPQDARHARRRPRLATEIQVSTTASRFDG